MSIAVRERLMTVEEFLDWHPDDEKWELVGGIPWRMMSEGDFHETVKTNVSNALGRRLRAPNPCRPGSNGKLVRIDNTTGYRPDAHINYAPVRGPMKALIEKPVVVFEVAVTSLESDLTDKRNGYFVNPHVEHLIVVNPMARKVHHFRRGSAIEDILNVGDTLSLDGTASLDLPIAEFFEWPPEII